MASNEDERIDQLLSRAMAGEVPRLSASFDAEVMSRLTPRRLSSTGRTVIVVYAIVATGATAWFMRDLPMIWIAAGLSISMAVAAGAGLYGRHMVQGGR